MSLRRMVGMEGGVADLQFEIRPRSVMFEQGNRYFALYFEKGMQVMGKFESGFTHNTRDNMYRFRSPSAACFRLNSLAHSGYSWTLYAVDPATQLETYLDCANFDIAPSVKMYEVELLEKEREIQTTHKEKVSNRSAVLEIWRRLRSQLRMNRPILKCHFQKHAIHLEFQLEIRNSLDLELAKRTHDDQRRALSRTRSDPSDSATHFNTAPDNHKPPVEEGLYIVDELSSPLLDEARRKHELELRSARPFDISAAFAHSQPAEKPDEEEFVATVKIMDPRGEQLEADHDEWAAVMRRHEDDRSQRLSITPPTKKFSMLSDIIQKTEEGSSSYGNPDKRSNGFNNFYPNHQDAIEQEEEENSQETQPLNKFKTLQYEHRSPKLEVREEYRRAQTAEKFHSDNHHQVESVSQIHEESILQPSDIKTVETKDTKAASKAVGNPNAKWVIMVAVLVILGMLGGEWFLCCSEDTVRRPKLKRRKVK